MDAGGTTPGTGGGRAASGTAAESNAGAITELPSCRNNRRVYAGRSRHPVSGVGLPGGGYRDTSHVPVGRERKYYRFHLDMTHVA